MKLRWVDGFDVPAILEILKGLRDRRVISLWLPVLTSATHFDPAVPPNERLSLVRKSIAAVLARPHPTADHLATALSREQAAYLALSERMFVLVASVSLGCLNSLYGRRVLAGCTFYLSRVIPDNFISPQLGSDARAKAIPPHPDTYMKVRVYATARSPHEGRERAFFALDALRGVWGFALGFGQIVIPKANLLSQPTNKIGLGPRFTLHQPDGALAAKWLGAIDPLPALEDAFSDTARVARLRSKERWVKRQLKSLQTASYQDTLLTVFARFARAIDYIDESAALLELWSLVESLTGTADARYEVTVRRASNLFRQRQAVRSLLQHLRSHRNDVAHYGGEPELGELLISQARFVVEVLLDFHLSYGRRFQSFDEACLFLELPSDPSILQRQIVLRNIALHYQHRVARFDRVS